ncbi:EamA family transporter [Candidatus Roizmanbacteria bacterium]|nr:EamA family transporter [Candidatus Roizmanbacteria bacterium]
MPFIILAWIASILYGIVVILSKLLSKHSIKNPWLFAFLWSFITLVFTTSLSLYNHVSFPNAWDNLIIISLSGAFVWILFTLALYKLDASVISPLYNLRTAFSAILSAIILSEILSYRQYFLIFLIIIAGIFVTLDEKFNFRSFFKKSILILLTGILFSSISGVFTNLSQPTALYCPGFYFFINCPKTS